MRITATLLLSLLLTFTVTAQSSFNYSLSLNPVSVPGLPGLQAYAQAQHNGKWLIVGGRRDGLHARQPFNSFPQSQNNTDIFVVDVYNGQFWSSSVTNLPTSIAEQLQSTNMNFCQREDTMYIVGGYAYSNTAADHITFPYLTTINVSGVINAIINGNSISSFFKQITDTAFAVTGGHLDHLNDTFYLVGGQRFDGRYNPMGNPTYTQTYTNQIRKFMVNNSGSQLSFSGYTAITDPVHLHRRDYNLLPQIFPDGQQGFTISSGVFQINVDLPFLYPVDITANGYTPQTTFNQYLSNYHSAYACLYDSSSNAMHSLFFGGMSQYYYSNNTLIQDNQVPFVKTISRVTRDSSGNLNEYQLPVEMPALRGSSAEFIYNTTLPHYESHVIKLSSINQDSILIGHIYGGIYSPQLNPFSSNQTSVTSADTTIYEVWLIRNQTAGTNESAIDGKNPHDITVFPNPAKEKLNVRFNLNQPTDVAYFITNANGQIVKEETFKRPLNGEQNIRIQLGDLAPQPLMLTFVFDDKYYVTRNIILE
jgi:hypothetical protein